MSESVLLIDDDEALLRSVQGVLTNVGFSVACEASGASGIQAYEREPADAVVLDLRLPDMSGLDVLKTLKASGASVILLTGHGDVPTAVEALRLGAEDFLTKPIDVSHFTAAVKRTVSASRLRSEIDRLKTELNAHVTLESLGKSDTMRAIAEEIERLAVADRSPILLVGESGTGKGFVARLIHRISPREHGPFMRVACSGLFDHAEFAADGRAGQADPRLGQSVFDQADGGVLFLDEIGDLALDRQAKLLGILDEHSPSRQASDGPPRWDIRFICATNQDLGALVVGGRFRKDLLYRISRAVVRLPPLRERSSEDLEDLAQRLLRDLAIELPAAPTTFDQGALTALIDHSWPGNVREMRNVLEWALIMGREDAAVRLEHLPQALRGSRPGGDQHFRGQSLEEIERHHVARMLSHHGGNRTRAARDLGISRATLIQKIKRYGLR